jgi:hypothetical protein
MVKLQIKIQQIEYKVKLQIKIPTLYSHLKISQNLI